MLRTKLSHMSVDEFLSFLPAENGLGSTISVADTRPALDVLRKANETGHGDVRAYRKTALPDQGGDGGFSPNLNVTIAEVLGDEHYIDANVAVLLQEMGLNETYVVRIPMLF
ncbi:Catabolite repression protein creC [Lasiodiplodia theobromae]|uniref:Catabolite repression protein creC n=1 Tax=Lasiodiplodia theobromae TaxID=45133 RepID=UPI0015C304B1|nr:Catabolite repression protein creC [Lasiodiplodia theobromae]KAF4536947.1 Catabolite repression protein creC [Lasiodiplodia theobromae]